MGCRDFFVYLRRERLMDEHAAEQRGDGVATYRQ